MKTITRERWNKIPKDYKCITDGQHKILELTDKGTTLVPVRIKSC